MSKDKFNELMNQFSSEADHQKAEDARMLQREAQRARWKSILMSLVVIALIAVVTYKYAEIRDAVAQLIQPSEPEYKQILKIAGEVDAEKSGKAAATGNPSAREAKLKDAVRKAKEAAVTVDGIMDYDPQQAQAPKSPPNSAQPQPPPKP